MKRFLSFLMLAAPAATIFAALPQEGSGETNGYKLVWQDLFDSGELNPLRWHIEVNGDGGGNNELQYYTENNVRVGDDGDGNGCLILTARRENYKNKSFTSGRLNSSNFVTFTHGKVEASIKFPSTANGLWPAFWMMGNDYSSVGWPRCGETDFIEMGNSNGIARGTQDRYFNGACHWGQGWPAASYALDTTRPYSMQDGEYHLITCIWDTKEIRMYADLDKYPSQSPYYIIDISNVDPSDEWCAGNYFHKDNFLIFNLAIGGDFTGIHDPAKITAFNDANGQEASMYINYVKIYQKGTPDETLFAAVDGDTESPVLPDDPSIGDEPENPDDPTGAVENLTADLQPVPVVVFNAGGLIVAKGISAENLLNSLPAGVYIVKEGSATKKIIKR